MLIIIRYKHVILLSLSVTTVWRMECTDFSLVLYYIPLSLKKKTVFRRWKLISVFLDGQQDYA